MARTKTLTKPQIARGAKLRAAVEAARSAIFAGEMHVPFNQMYRTAPDGVRELLAFEFEMQAEGRGWFEAGRFRAYGYIFTLPY